MSRSEGNGTGLGGFVIIPIPREATSVATMMGLFPVLNSFKTQSRSFCCLSPWIAVKELAMPQAGYVNITDRGLANHPGEGIS